MDSQAITAQQWVLVGLTDHEGELTDALPDVEATLEFADGRIGGSASCNRFTTSGELTDIPDMFATTMMMCPEPVMSQERRYLGLLPQIDAVSIVDGQLVATDAHGATILVWRQRRPTD